MIKVHDIAYVRFAAPDLGAMDRFLVAFGLVVTARDGDRIYARGTDPSPYVHGTELGDPGFRGVAFEAASAEDLTAAATLEGASSVEKIDAPGGGQRVRFKDPDGYEVEVVHGRELLPRLTVRSAGPINRGSDHPRKGTLQRIDAGPAGVKRLGHLALRVTDYDASSGWYKSRFGFVASDEVFVGDASNVIAAFLRCDLGDEYTDHHTMVCFGTGERAFDHAAFEVEDVDAVMVGHDHLEEAGFRHKAGIGRHVLGSQVFDYWRDPWGHTLEHFTDGDLLNDEHPTGAHDPGVALGTQWGTFTP
jgi:catechol 2,3-dioxygenase-like lactoylglutathione lyase family enzyme